MSFRRLISYRLDDHDFASDLDEDWEDAQSNGGTSFRTARAGHSRSGSFVSSVPQGLGGTPPPQPRTQLPTSAAGEGTSPGLLMRESDDQEQDAIDNDFKATRLAPPVELTFEDLQANKRARSNAGEAETAAAGLPPTAADQALDASAMDDPIRLRVSSAGGATDAVQVVLQLARPTDEEVTAGTEPVLALGPKPTTTDTSTATAAGWRGVADSASSPDFLMNNNNTSGALPSSPPDSQGLARRSDQQQGAGATATAPSSTGKKIFPRSFSSSTGATSSTLPSATKGLKNLFSSKFWSSSSKKRAGDDIASSGATSAPLSDKAAAQAYNQDVVNALVDNAARKPVQVNTLLTPDAGYVQARAVDVSGGTEAGVSGGAAGLPPGMGSPVGVGGSPGMKSAGVGSPESGVSNFAAPLAMQTGDMAAAAGAAGVEGASGSLGAIAAEEEGHPVPVLHMSTSPIEQSPTRPATTSPTTATIAAEGATPAAESLPAAGFTSPSSAIPTDTANTEISPASTNALAPAGTAGTTGAGISSFVGGATGAVAAAAAAAAVAVTTGAPAVSSTGATAASDGGALAAQASGAMMPASGGGTTTANSGATADSAGPAKDVAAVAAVPQSAATMAVKTLKQVVRKIVPDFSPSAKASAEGAPAAAAAGAGGAAAGAGLNATTSMATSNTTMTGSTPPNSTVSPDPSFDVAPPASAAAGAATGATPDPTTDAVLEGTAAAVQGLGQPEHCESPTDLPAGDPADYGASPDPALPAASMAGQPGSAAGSITAAGAGVAPGATGAAAADAAVSSSKAGLGSMGAVAAAGGAAAAAGAVAAALLGGTSGAAGSSAAPAGSATTVDDITGLPTSITSNVDVAVTKALSGLNLPGSSSLHAAAAALPAGMSPATTAGADSATTATTAVDAAAAAMKPALAAAQAGAANASATVTNAAAGVQQQAKDLSASMTSSATNAMDNVSKAPVNVLSSFALPNINSATLAAAGSDASAANLSGMLGSAVPAGGVPGSAAAGAGAGIAAVAAGVAAAAAAAVGAAGAGAAPSDVAAAASKLEGSLPGFGSAADGAIAAAQPLEGGAEGALDGAAAAAAGADVGAGEDHDGGASLDLGTRKRKADSEVNPEDEGRWAPDAPAAVKGSNDAGAADSANLSDTFAAATTTLVPGAADVIAADDTAAAIGAPATTVTPITSAGPVTDAVPVGAAGVPAAAASSATTDSSTALPTFSSSGVMGVPGTAAAGVAAAAAALGATGAAAGAAGVTRDANSNSMTFPMLAGGNVEGAVSATPITDGTPLNTSNTPATAAADTLAGDALTQSMAARAENGTVSAATASFPADVSATVQPGSNGLVTLPVTVTAAEAAKQASDKVIGAGQATGVAIATTVNKSISAAVAPLQDAAAVKELQQPLGDENVTQGKTAILTDAASQGKAAVTGAAGAAGAGLGKVGASGKAAAAKGKGFLCSCFAPEVK